MDKPSKLTLKRPPQDQTDVGIEFSMQFRIFWSLARLLILHFDRFWIFSTIYSMFFAFLTPKPQVPAQTMLLVI